MMGHEPDGVVRAFQAALGKAGLNLFSVGGHAVDQAIQKHIQITGRQCGPEMVTLFHAIQDISSTDCLQAAQHTSRTGEGNTRFLTYSFLKRNDGISHPVEENQRSGLAFPDDRLVSLVPDGSCAGNDGRIGKALGQVLPGQFSPVRPPVLAGKDIAGPGAATHGDDILRIDVPLLGVLHDETRGIVHVLHGHLDGIHG